jgi:hypothetical protein
MAGLFENFQPRVERAYEVLRGPTTAFVLVTGAEEQVLGDAEYLSTKMAELHMPLKGVVFNRVHHEFRPAGRGPRRAEVGLEDVEEVAAAVARALGGAGQEARALAENFVAYQALARGESLRLEQFRLGLPRGVPIVRVPNFARDVHDLASLAAMHAHLFAGRAAASVPNRIAAALRLVRGNVALLGGIVLAVSLPVNLLARALAAAGHATASLHATLWGGLLLGPISAGALVHALACIADGRPVGWREAMGVGLARGGRLLKAWVVSGALVLLGLVAGVVPGIVLMVRWAVLDAVVVLEDLPVMAALGRSAALTAGRRWPILATGLACFAVYGLVAALFYRPAGLADRLDGAVGAAALDRARPALRAWRVVFFVFYREARAAEDEGA